MSDAHGSGSGVSPTGHGTHPGGGNRVGPSPVHPGSPGAVCNQALLVLDPTVFATLTHAEARSVALFQLAYAREVSMAAANAYEAILGVLRAGEVA